MPLSPFSATMLALSCIVLATHSPCIAAPEEAADRRSVRVMSFNIRYANPRDGANQWKFRKDLFAATVRAFDPDILGTQEVVADQFEDLREMFPTYTAVGVARDDGKRKGEWSAIFFRTARFEQLAAGTFWLSDEPDAVGSKGWDGDCVRICTWARLRERGTDRQFVHANTHFDHKGSVARLEAAKLLARRLPKIASGTGVILTGDFNCGDDAPPYKLLTASNPGAFRLLDSYRELYPSRAEEEGTFHGFEGTTTGQRIDWILHTPHLKPIAAQIVRTTGELHPSDHYPITATFEYAP